VVVSLSFKSAFLAAAVVLFTFANLDAQESSKSSGVNCGPPQYSCSRSDTAMVVSEHPPQLGSDPLYYGGHSGAGAIGIDPAYGNPILRVTDGNLNNGESFNLGASAEKNPWSYDETLFSVHDEGNQLCLFQFDASAFQSSFRGCYWNMGAGGGADFGYTSADNHAIFNFYLRKLYRFAIDTNTWNISSQLLFDPDSPNCLNGQMAANHWYVHDHAMSSDDQTTIASIGPKQDADPYVVVWNASKGCQWVNVQTWQASAGWNTGLQKPVAASWKGGVTPSAPGGVHNVQVDRGGSFGILAIHKDGLENKIFWQIGTNLLDGTCDHCTSHWACDYGVCFWNMGKGTGYKMHHQPIGSLTPVPDMDSTAAEGEWGEDEHASHANAEPGVKNIYLVSWQPGPMHLTEPQVWKDEIIGVNWDGSERTIRFNKNWNSGYGGFWGSARCSISRHGNYALCGSDYQMFNIDKGFGSGLNQDQCDHMLQAGRHGTNGCRTDVLLFQLR
jgi:hypothetical protein